MAEDKLNQSLDDIIKEQEKTKDTEKLPSKGYNRNRGSGGGGRHRGSGRSSRMQSRLHRPGGGEAGVSKTRQVFRGPPNRHFSDRQVLSGAYGNPFGRTVSMNMSQRLYQSAPLRKPYHAGYGSQRQHQVRHFKELIKQELTQIDHERLEGERRWAADKFPQELINSIGPLKGNYEGFKLIIRNLHYEVDRNDVQELFSMFGEVTKFDIQWDDKSGRSLGNAWVLFKERKDAEEAMEHYNGVALDGQPMKIELEEQPQRMQTLTSGRKLTRDPYVRDIRDWDRLPRVRGRGSTGGMQADVIARQPQRETKRLGSKVVVDEDDAMEEG